MALVGISIAMSAEAATEKKIQEETTTKTEYSPEDIEAEKQRLSGKKTTTTEQTTETTTAAEEPK